jgi:protein required for attachment to host cells
MTDLRTGDWVLIADSEKALFLENVGDEIDMNLEVRRKREQENPPSGIQGANRPGRAADDGPGQRSALDDTDWHALEKARFADDLAERLYDRAHRGEFRRIVLVADPRTLGRLREKLHKEVAEKVIAEAPKDFTNMPLDEVEKRLAAELR